MKKKQRIEIVSLSAVILTSLLFIVWFLFHGHEAVEPVPVEPVVHVTPKPKPVVVKPPHTEVTVTQMSAPAFAYAHGTVMADGKIFIGMADKNGNPFPTNEIVIFTDPHDLTKMQIISIQRPGDIESMVYDATHDKIYFTLERADDLEIYALDPQHYGVDTVFATTSIAMGPRPAIVTDGRYIYGLTNTDPSTAFKINLTDHSFVSDPIGHISNGHSAAIGVFGSTTELYFASGMSNRFEKTDGATLHPLETTSFTDCAISDDTPFVQTDSSGGYVYLGCEKDPAGYRVDTHDLSLKKFSLPGYSFGLFVFGPDLYNAAQDGHYDVFKQGNIDSIKRYFIGQDIPLNELFYATSTDDLLFTGWWGIKGLYEVPSSSRW